MLTNLKDVRWLTGSTPKVVWSPTTTGVEETLRRSFLKDGRYHDQHPWSILDTDWRAEGARRPEFRLIGSIAAVASEVATRVH